MGEVLQEVVPVTVLDGEVVTLAIPAELEAEPESVTVLEPVTYVGLEVGDEMETAGGEGVGEGEGDGVGEGEGEGDGDGVGLAVGVGLGVGEEP